MTYVAVRCETPYAMSVADSCHTNKKPQSHCGIVLLIHRLTTTQVVTSVSSQTHGIAHLNALSTQKSDHLQVPCQAVDPNYLQTDWTTDLMHRNWQEPVAHIDNNSLQRLLYKGFASNSMTQNNRCVIRDDDSLSYIVQTSCSNKINSKTLQLIVFYCLFYIIILCAKMSVVICGSMQQSIIITLYILQYVQYLQKKCCSMQHKLQYIECSINNNNTCRCKYCFNWSILCFSFWGSFPYIRYAIHSI